MIQIYILELNSSLLQYHLASEDRAHTIQRKVLAFSSECLWVAVACLLLLLVERYLVDFRGAILWPLPLGHQYNGIMLAQQLAAATVMKHVYRNFLCIIP